MNTLTNEPHVCSHTHSFSLDNFLRRLFQSPGKILSPYLKNCDVAVDIGCGPGFFTTTMAQLVGDKGRVLAVDLQREMLDKLQFKLSDSPLADRIQLHQCKQDSLDIEQGFTADFILAYYMVHETPCQRSFFAEVKNILKNRGQLLVVEPPFHVKKAAFQETEKAALASGLQILDKPKKKGGFSLLLTHAS